MMEATFHKDIGFVTVYHRIYCHISLTLFNQMWSYIPKCINLVDKAWRCIFILINLTEQIPVIKYGDIVSGL